MTQQSLLKSAAITLLDTLPPLSSTTGEGGPAYLKNTEGSVVCLTGDLNTSRYQIVRLPSNAKVKHVRLSNAALSASTTLNVAVYYSDAPTLGIPDGTQASLAGTLVSGAGTFFGNAIACTTANESLDITNQSGSYPINLRNQQLWQALGLSVDPYGFFDLVIIPAVTVVAGGLVGLSVDYAE